MGAWVVGVMSATYRSTKGKISYLSFSVCIPFVTLLFFFLLSLFFFFFSQQTNSTLYFGQCKTTVD
jgi:hypothetical protein